MATVACLGSGGPMCSTAGRLPSLKSKPDEAELDSGWDDEGDLDAGWHDAHAIDAGWDEAGDAAADAVGAPRRALTAEEREARAARDATRKAHKRVKAGEKSERRKSRAAAASSKQKKQEKRTGARPAAAPVAERKARRQVEEGPIEVDPRVKSSATGGSTATVRRPGVPLAVIVVLVLVVAAGAVGLILARR